MEQHHVAITPLMRGFDAQLPIRNSQEAHDFLEEAGKTLKATIEGLLALQRSQHGLRDKHLRPIEDNPLRLNMDYDTTLNLMFADQKARFIFQRPPPWPKAWITCVCIIRPINRRLRKP